LNKRGNIDSTSAAVAEGVNAITVAEIEAVVQKAVTAAVSAATAVLREEFCKLFHDIQRRLSSLEDRMEVIETRPELPANNSPLVAVETMRELESIRKKPGNVELLRTTINSIQIGIILCVSED
jgi:uncharacterized protein YicC (UPF0701 family)